VDTGDQAPLLVEISDNGHGFNCEAVLPGMGLVSMRERAEHLGGTLEIRSAADTGATGTIVSVRFGKASLSS
jgi:signal transduction histidine kinase